MVGKVSEQDRAVVKKAAALIARSPELKPTAALRKLGIRSEERIKRLRSALKKPTAQASRQVSKAATPKTAASVPKPTKTAALKVQGATDARDAIVAPIPAKRDIDDSTVLPAKRANETMAPFAPMALVVNAQLALWSNVMRWTPVGIVMKMAISNNAAAWNLIVPKRQ